MTSGLLDINADQPVVVPVWKYRFDIGPGAWECPAFKGTAGLIRSQHGTAYEGTVQLVPLSRINAQGEYLPPEVDQPGGALVMDSGERTEAHVAAEGLVGRPRKPAA